MYIDMYDTYCTGRYMIYRRGLLLLITSVRKYNYKRKTILADLLKSKNKLIYSFCERVGPVPKFITQKKRWQCTWKSAIERRNNMYICNYTVHVKFNN